MLDGWQELTPELLDECRQALTAEQLAHYFDGQEPNWRHALAPAEQIPRRPVAVDGLAHLLASGAGRGSMVLLVGPDGMGKSTALRQIAADLVAAGRKVLFRSPGARLDPAAVAELDPGEGWVLASDDADEIAHDVEGVVEQLFAAGRGDVAWLLSARDVDWKAQFVRNGRSIEPPWDRSVDLWPTLSNRAGVLAVTAEATEASGGLAAWMSAGTTGAAADAPTILEAWAAAGCLGALAKVAPGERAEALEERGRKKLGISDATLLGASLDLRYGEAGLPALVETAVRGLGRDGLREAFLCVAAARVAGVDGLDLLVLADLVGVDGDQARDAIAAPLAEAALASGTAGVLRVRHPAVGHAAVGLLATGQLEGDLEDLYRRLVRGTAATGNDMKGLAAGGAIMNCGPVLAEKLQQAGVDEARSHRVACAVAEEAEQALPDFLLFSVGRARTYRAAARPADARRVLRDRLADATTKNDWDMVGRSFLHELSGPETSVGRLAEGAALAGLALADGDGLGQVTMADGKMALLALGNACTEFVNGGTAAGDNGALFRRQLRSCTHLGEKVTPKWDQRARFDFHTFKVSADSYGIPPTTAAEALVWLGETVKATVGMVEDAEVRDLARRVVPDGGTLAFSHLEYTIGLGRLPWAKE